MRSALDRQDRYFIYPLGETDMYRVQRIVQNQISNTNTITNVKSKMYALLSTCIHACVQIEVRCVKCVKSRVISWKVDCTVPEVTENIEVQLSLRKCQ